MSIAIRIIRDGGYRHIELEPSPYISVGRTRTAVVLDADEWHDLVAAVEAEQAWESGDHATEYTKGAAA